NSSSPSVFSVCSCSSSNGYGSGTAGLATIGHDASSGDKSGAIRSQKRRQIGDLFRAAKPAQRHFILDKLHHLIPPLRQMLFPGAAREKNIARRNTIDPNIVQCQLPRKDLRIVDKRSFSD